MNKLADLLDPVQLGFIYESLLKNAIEALDDGPKAISCYVAEASFVKAAIDANFGWDEYSNLDKFYQSKCRELANYDDTMTPELWAKADALIVNV